LEGFEVTCETTVPGIRREHHRLRGVCPDGAARSLAEQPKLLLRSVRDELDDDPAFTMPADDLRALLSAGRARRRS
jgi:hypothetical protein